MNRKRTAIALSAGVVAALGVGGVALASASTPSLPGVSSFSSPSSTASPDATASPDSTASGDSTAFPESTVSPDATASADAAGAGLPGTAGTASPGSTAGSGSAGGQGISVEQARSIALKAVGGGTVTKVERETEHGRAVWDVYVSLNGVSYDIDVDRATGAVSSHRNGGHHGRGSDDSRDDSRDGSDDSRHGSDDSRRGSEDSRHGHGSDDSSRR
jgi:hypothetical protein